MSSDDWKALIESVFVYPAASASIVQSLLSALISQQDAISVEAIAIHIVNLAIDHPSKTDALLSLYADLTSSLPDDYQVGDFTGKEVAIRALGLQFYDILQSLNPVLKPIPIDLLDDTCQDVPEDVDPVLLAVSVRQMAAHRRTYVVAAAMYARSQTMDALTEEGADMGISNVRASLGLTEGAVKQVEANHVAAVMYILAAGSSLSRNLSPAEREETMRDIVDAVKKRVKSERTFHLKVLWSNALAMLISGEEGWSSERLFGNSSSLWVM